jgi:D-3-phosphoglycerate dehydrogenase
MKKILFISDGLFTKEDLADEAMAEILKPLEKYDVQIDVAADTAAQRFSGKPTEFIMKVEREGPEWIEPDQEIMDKIQDADVLVAHFSGVNSKMMDAAKKLKLIGVMRSGVENVSLEEAKKRGIPVINCPGRVSEPVADFTVALLLIEVRNILRIGSELAKGKWAQYDHTDSAMTTLRNHVAGLVGFGMGRKLSHMILSSSQKSRRP